MKETGVGAVKLEGGKKRAGLSMLPALCCWLLVRHMVDAGIAVQGHIGLTPQSVSTLGGFRVQGKTCIFCLHCFIDKMITPWESLRTRRLWRKQVVSLLSLNVYGLRDESHGCRFLLWSARLLPSPSMSPPSVLVQVLTLLVKYILSSLFYCRFWCTTTCWACSSILIMQLYVLLDVDDGCRRLPPSVSNTLRLVLRSTTLCASTRTRCRVSSSLANSTVLIRYELPSMLIV